MILGDLARCLNPALLAKDVGIELDAWQDDLLRSDDDRIAACCSRQTGKTTTTSLLVCSTALYRLGSLTVVLSPTHRQSAEFTRVVVGYLKKLGAHIISESALRIELANKSRVVALPSSEAGIRGLVPDLVLVDEAARVEQSLFQAVIPMSPVSNARMVLLSTPFSRSGFFWEIIEGGKGDGWKIIKVPASECPPIRHGRHTFPYCLRLS